MLASPEWVSVGVDSFCFDSTEKLGEDEQGQAIYQMYFYVNSKTATLDTGDESEGWTIYRKR